jgi:hypothetical protein
MLAENRARSFLLIGSDILNCPVTLGYRAQAGFWLRVF